MTIREMVAAYYQHADSYYRDGDGAPSYEAELLRLAGTRLSALYGNDPVDSFGPKGLKQVRQGMIDADLSRNYINDTVARIARIFRWAVSEELAPPNAWHALSAVEGLRRNRSAARETSPVLPVDDATVEATLTHLPPIVADMVKVQRLTGCRPGEVCLLRACDIDRSRVVWIYCPSKHKNQWRGRKRVICIGPKAQAILAPYLERPAEAFCFSPRETIAAMRLRRRAERKTPRYREYATKTNPLRPHRAVYSRYSYRRAIHRACDRAGIPRWSPNQLRHAAATELRKEFGLEAAQVILGHAKADVTQIYAERDERLAMEVAAKAG